MHTAPNDSAALSSETIQDKKSTTTKANGGSSSNGSSFRKSDSERVLSKQSINPAVLKAEYAVRGEIAIRAEELRHECESEEGRKRLGFDKVISCNIGNPQQTGMNQKPITFFRQVASLTEYPDLLENPLTEKIFPKDAIARAKQLLHDIGSVGAYSHSKGVPAIRKNIAAFIERRDGYPADPEDIYLTTGASGGVSNILQLAISDPSCGVLIPIPQYPLYTAALALNNAIAVSYYLQEDDKWGIDINEMRASVHKAREEGTDVRAVVVINPGNPTGQCLSEENMAEIVKLAYEEKMVIVADEVYQTNVFDPETKPFKSFKSVVRRLGPPYSENQELVSFHSISKGQVGECGRRGGYYELVNMADEAKEQIYKLASIQLCSNVAGQIGVDLMVNPPKEGEESYELYTKEITSIQASLKKRSEKIHQAFEKMENVTCNHAEGALYLFPQIDLPKGAIEAAKSAGKAPDAFYCLQLLEQTGICVIPGSGFGQKEGTLHFRTTFLAPEVEEFVDRIKVFHDGFMKQYT